jgi:hypothetical protein
MINIESEDKYLRERIKKKRIANTLKLARAKMAIKGYALIIVPKEMETDSP